MCREAVGSYNFCAFSGFSRFLGAAESHRNQAGFGVLIPSEKSPELLGTTGAEVNEAVSKRQYVDIIVIIIAAFCSVHGRE